MGIGRIRRGAGRVCARQAVCVGVLVRAVLAMWAVLVGATPWGVQAQAPGACALRASPSVASLAEAAGRVAARRLARPLTLGAPLEDDTPRALGACVLGLTRGPGGLRIFATDAGGGLREVEVGDDGDEAATTRALAVALSTLLLQLEIANPANPANPTNPVQAGAANGDDLSNSAQGNPVNPPDPLNPANPANPPDAEGGSLRNPALTGPVPRATGDLRPFFVVDVHARAPISTLRATSGAGLGGLIGLCLRDTVCAFVSAEYVLPDERPAWAGAPASYRWGNAAALAQLIAWRHGTWALGTGLGVVARLSEVTLDGRTTRGASLSAGVRAQLEGSLTLARAWSFVVALGTDLYFDRAAFVQGGRTLLVEDFVTPWGALALRFRTP